MGLLVHAPLQATYLLNLARKNEIEFNSFEYKATAPLVYNNNFFVEIGENQDDEIIGRILNEKQEISMIAKYKKWVFIKNFVIGHHKKKLISIR